MRVYLRAVVVVALAGLNTNCGSDSDSGHSAAAGGVGASGASANAAAGSSGSNSSAGSSGSSTAAAGSGGSGTATGGTATDNGGGTNATAGTGTGNGNGGAAGSGPFQGNPNGDWANVTSNLAGMTTMCGNTGLVVARPDKDEVIAAVALHGLWSTTDSGKTWTQIAGSPKLTNSASTLLFDPKDSTHYWVVGNHASPFMVATTDDGASFTTPGDGQYQGLDYISIDFTDPKRNVQLVGWHESAQSVSLSTDGGSTWKAVGSKLPGGVYCSTPYVVDAQTFLVGCADGQIQRSTDAGGTWTQVSKKGSSRGPLAASDGSVYWACTDGSLIRTTDGGVTWSEILGANSLQAVTPPVELPDGRVAAVAKDGILAGKHDGTWTHVAPTIPTDLFTMTYSAQEKAFYFGHGDCNAVVPDNAIQRFAYDYTKN